MKDLLDHQTVPVVRDFDLLRTGRHFRLSDRCKAVVGRAASAYGQMARSVQGTSTTVTTPTASQSAFVDKLGPAATTVAKEAGIPASFMLGQAGHETGWGRSEIKNADGTNAYNLFGIKATSSWTGKVAEITTTEYIDGEARKVTAKFRAYDSYEDSFRDYAKLINNNPRYEKARAQTDSATAYAMELQKAGYATDPAYARKLSGAIQSALRAMA